MDYKKNSNEARFIIIIIIIFFLFFTHLFSDGVFHLDARVNLDEVVPVTRKDKKKKKQLISNIFLFPCSLKRSNMCQLHISGIFSILFLFLFFLLKTYLQQKHDKMPADK